jgi:hypothetical protein
MKVVVVAQLDAALRAVRASGESLLYESWLRYSLVTAHNLSQGDDTD